MQDPYVIMNTGFKNTVEGGTTSGYQLDIRIPYYRSVYLSAIHSLDLSVDGAAVPQQDIRIVVAGKPFTMAGMFEADSVRWGFGDPATLLVTHAGGLKPGIHTVKVGIVVRKSYLPATDPEHCCPRSMHAAQKVTEANMLQPAAAARSRMAVTLFGA